MALDPGSAVVASGKRRKPVRYAVVGLGYIAQEAVIPAFDRAKNSRLAALVSDDPVKLAELGNRHQIAYTWSYAEYDACLASGEIDAVYIALPNHLHHEYAVRAAEAGIHVLCEKPMALTELDCESMIRAAEMGNARLMVGYRLHFQPANLQAIEIIRSGKIGSPRIVTSAFAMQVQMKDGDIRLRRETGGGSLWDLGVYCVNASRYLFESEPIEVTAFRADGGDPRFREVDEAVGATLKFPGGRLATFVSSFGASGVSHYEVVGTRGSLRVENAYDYGKPGRHVLTVDGHEQRQTFRRTDQFAAEIQYFSNCVLTGATPEPGGIEGLIDVSIVRALYRSAETGRSVVYEGPRRNRRPGEDQQIETAAPGREQELVNTSAPSR